MAGRFEDEERPAFTQHESVAVAIERTRRLGRLVVASAEGAEVAETGDAHGSRPAVAAAGQYDVDEAHFDPLPGDAEGDVAAGACRRDRGARPGQVQERSQSRGHAGTVGLGMANRIATGVGVAFPLLHPFRAKADNQADASLIRQARVAERAVAAP